MRADSIAFAVAGCLFGLIVGWILGSQQAQDAARAPSPAVPQQAAAAQSPPAGSSQAVPLDEQRVQEMRNAAERNATDARPRIELGNMYFDAERYQDAIVWYEDALRLDPDNVDVSTDLGVAYYYTNQPERAVAQFERSLAIDPAHTKTLLNLGIVKAFGQQDLEGAARAWERVVELAPDSPEGQAARRALEGLRSAHPDAGTGKP